MRTTLRISYNNLFKNREGFTLLELIFVVVIIGLLAGLIVPRFVGKVGKSKVTIAKAQVEALATALEAYKMDTAHYPSNEQGLAALIKPPPGEDRWDGPYLHKSVVPKDPWGVEYIYKYPGQHGSYDIISYGSDGKEGGTGQDADIVSWE